MKFSKGFLHTVKTDYRYKMIEWMSFGCIRYYGSDHPIWTFDDGPSDYTERVIESLQMMEVEQAVFFVNRTWEQNSARKREIKSIIDAGYEVGNHTAHHVRLKAMDRGKFYREVVEFNHELEDVAGKRIQWFRPPYGEISRKFLPLIFANGLKIMMYSLDSLDWKLETEEVIRNVILSWKQRKKKDILLFHDDHERILTILNGLAES